MEIVAEVVESYGELTGIFPISDSEIEPPSFIKDDIGKLRYDLLPVNALEKVVEGLTYGAHKYEDDNWRNNSDMRRFIGAAMRHIEQYRNGVTTDVESGIPHLGLAVCNLLFILELTDEGSPDI